jgi:hypothetical protein
MPVGGRLEGTHDMNPVFLTLACLAVGVAVGATGHLYWGVPFVIAAIVIASAFPASGRPAKAALFQPVSLPNTSRRARFKASARGDRTARLAAVREPFK